MEKKRNDQAAKLLQDNQQITFGQQESLTITDPCRSIEIIKKDGRDVNVSPLEKSLTVDSKPGLHTISVDQYSPSQVSRRQRRQKNETQIVTADEQKLRDIIKNASKPESRMANGRFTKSPQLRVTKKDESITNAANQREASMIKTKIAFGRGMSKGTRQMS